MAYHTLRPVSLGDCVMKATGTSDWADNKFVEGGSPGVDPWPASASDPDASLNEYSGWWDLEGQGPGEIVDWEAYWRMCSDLPIALAGNEIGTLGGTILRGKDISGSRSWYISFFFLRRRNSSRKRITATNTTTPPTAPPTIAPVGAPLCSIDAVFKDPSGLDELGEGVLEEPGNEVDEAGAGAFWMIT